MTGNAEGEPLLRRPVANWIEKAQTETPTPPESRPHLFALFTSLTDHQGFQDAMGSIKVAEFDNPSPEVKKRMAQEALRVARTAIQILNALGDGKGMPKETP